MSFLEEKYQKHFEEKKRKEREKFQEDEKINKQKQEQLKILLKLTIEKIVKLHIDETVKFPSLLSITNTPIKDEDYLKAFQKIIKDENNTDINLDILYSLILEEHTTQTIFIFKKSFLELNPDIKDSKNLQDWVEAYVDTFGDNDNYQIEFSRMIEDEEIPICDTEEKRQSLKRAEKLCGLSSTEMVAIAMILKTTQERSISQLAKNLSVSMQNGDKLVKQHKITIDNIDMMSGLEFEHFLCELFSKNRYNAEVTKGSNDQGADLIIEKFGERTVIQAKCYSGAVSNSAIQEAVAAKAHYNCHKAMVITNNYFTRSAMELANSNNVELWDREKLEEQLKEFNFKCC